MSSRFLREYKIVVVGGGGVGKSAFIIQFVGGYFLSELDPTIEDSYRKQYSVDSEVVLFDILDTAGQEEYSAMREQYMRTCEGMIIMYSITSRVSFEEAFAFREQLLRVKERDYFPMLVVGNKSDQHSEREVPVQEGMAFATHAGCGFLEVSAKSCNNVDRTFFDIVREIRRFNKELPSSLSIPSKLPQTHRKRSPFSPRSLSISSLKDLFKPTKPVWDLDPEAEAIRQQTLNRMLIQCAKSNDKRRVKKLLERGANIQAQPGVEGNALHAASAVGHLDVVNLLLKCGAALNARESRGNTALHLAALEGHAEIVKVLLRRGAPVDTSCGMYGTALVAASTRGHTKVAQLLLERGAEVNARGGPFGSSFHAAAMIGKADLASLLHDYGAEIDSRGVGECTALQIAAFAGNVEVVRLLLDRNADVNLNGGKYGRALKAALDRGHFDVIDLLIKNGASDVDLFQGGNNISLRPNEPPQGSSSSLDIATEMRLQQQVSLSGVAPSLYISQPTHGETSSGLPHHLHQSLNVEPRADSASNTWNSATQDCPVLARSPLETSRVAPLAMVESQILPSGHAHYENANQIPFQWVRDLGRGSYGIVDEVTFTAIGGHSLTYARKILQNSGAQHIYRMIMDEIALFKRLRHKHVVEVLATYSFGKQYAIIMSPVAETDLKNFLHLGHPEQKMFRWFGCMTAALTYIHSEDIRHRDIKPANILVKGDDVLFTDFGIAKDFSQDSTTSSFGTVDAKSYMYCAPEVAAEKPRGRPSDIYSLSCVFLELATVLIGSPGFSLSVLHETIKANEMRAYHAKPSDVLQFLLGLCALTPDREAEGWATRQRYVLIFQWCFAMLYPEPKWRISGCALLSMIQSVDDSAPSPTIYIGECCKKSVPAQEAWPRLLQIWPTDEFLGRHLSWEELGEKLRYTVPKDIADDNND